MKISNSFTLALLLCFFLQTSLQQIPLAQTAIAANAVKIASVPTSASLVTSGIKVADVVGSLPEVTTPTTPVSKPSLTTGIKVSDIIGSIPIVMAPTTPTKPPTTPTTPPFPQAVIKEMSSRQARYHHYLWHNIRDNWNLFSPATQQQLTAIGWRPPRPSRRVDANGNIVAITDNRSGEDFLYMHRQMIKRVNDIITQTNDPYGKVTGWKTIPQNGDKDWPVPIAYTIPGSPSTTSAINSRKTLSYYTNTIKPTEDFFTDPAQLRAMTLGELGSRIEVTIHNWLHLRFSANSTYGYRPGSSGAIPTIDPKWDDPRYDWLADTYSSHVNPVFWKLHGWVNDRIIDWARANKLTVITWRGTWEGGPMSSITAAANAVRSSTASAIPLAITRISPLTISKPTQSVVATDSVIVPTLASVDLAAAQQNPTIADSQAEDEAQFADNTMNEVFQLFSQDDGAKETSFADDVKIDFAIPKPIKSNLGK